jgi:hypothetical protein
LAEATERAFLSGTSVENERKLNKAVSIVELLTLFFSDYASFTFARCGRYLLHRCIDSRWGDRRRGSSLCVEEWCCSSFAA